MSSRYFIARYRVKRGTPIKLYVMRFTVDDDTLNIRTLIGKPSPSFIISSVIVVTNRFDTISINGVVRYKQGNKELYRRAAIGYRDILRKVARYPTKQLKLMAAYKLHVFLLKCGFDERASFYA